MRGQFGINCTKGDLSPKSPKPNMWLLVNHTNPTHTHTHTHCIETNITAGNYKSVRGQSQNNAINGVMLITINHVITTVIFKLFFFLLLLMTPICSHFPMNTSEKISGKPLVHLTDPIPTLKIVIFKTDFH